MGNKVLVAQFLSFFPEIVIVALLDLEDELLRFNTGVLVVWRIEMPSLDFLKDVYIIFIRQMQNKNWHKKGYTRRKTHQSFQANFETFKVRRENKLPAWFLFSAINLISAYKQVSL